VRRTILLVIPVLLLVLLLVAVAAELPEEGGIPAGVQTRLDQYLTSLSIPGQSTVLAVERARKPWNFSRDMSQLVLGDSVYFQTDASLTWRQGGGPSPLPFPPKELWCALLSRQDDASDGRSYAVVFAGLHMDMYNGDWLIHEGSKTPFTPEFEEVLSRIGCEVELN
jgi:hypothetical protein